MTLKSEAGELEPTPSFVNNLRRTSASSGLHNQPVTGKLDH